MKGEKMRIVDAHCHIGVGRYKNLTPPQLIAILDKYGVDMAVVCPVEEHITVFNREGNDYILRAVKEYTNRLIGFATVNPWYGDLAVKELRRAASEGLKGLKLNSALQGYFINDELVYPVIEVAEELNLPVYFHTATPIFALPLQLAELAEDFPNVNFIMGHAAASDFWIDVVPSVKTLRNVYIETSIRGGNAVLQLAVHELGSHRIIFGSNTPVSDMKLELEKIDTLVLNDLERRRVLCENILGLLPGLKGA